ncbi:MAG: NAD(P)/FAD-dependent oxidoreductase [Chitinophagales bacterium]|nr:NAD(P)/FAD-dependent oxidoreductase [Chitinophagales bacterium]MCZ2392456.1 NAD(P)/FAD-dependent oxidoreductase [Chitinophagales bacterium]
MKLYGSYKQNPLLEDKYDVILIGSGLGCLTAAVFLSEQGKKVLILEKHYTPGGFTHTYTRNDYEWDVGVHYIGEVHRPQSIMAKLFHYIAGDELQWADMGEIFDRIVIQDREYSLHKGKANYIEQLKRQFPLEEDHIAIDKYIQAVFDCTKTANNFFAEKAMPNYISMFVGNSMRSGFLKHAQKTTLEVLQEITDNKELIAVLTAQYGDYGLPPSKSSFAIHATVVKHYLSGGAYPVGGSASIFNSIAKKIIDKGGKVLVSAAVEQILIHKGKAVGVRMKDGKTISANIVISGAGLHNTFKKLISDDELKLQSFKKQISNLKSSYGHLSLYIGLKYTADELGLNKANIWYYPNGNDHDQAVQNFMSNPMENEFPVVYISFPSAKDPKFSERYPGRATIEIVSVIPNDFFEQWNDTRWKKRGEDYEDLKEVLAQRLLKHLYRFVPQIEGKVDFYELSTPLTTKHFANYQRGEVYGLDHTPERFESKFLKPSTPISQLYLTGQDIVSVGIGGALMSGVLTASAILNTNLVEKVMKS